MTIGALLARVVFVVVALALFPALVSLGVWLVERRERQRGPR